MNEKRNFARMTLSLGLVMALERLTAFSGAYRAQGASASSDGTNLAFAVLLALIVVASRRWAPVRGMGPRAAATAGLGLTATALLITLLPGLNELAPVASVRLIVLRFGILLLLVGNMQQLAAMSMARAVQSLVIAACSSCVAVPLGYLSLLPEARFWVVGASLFVAVFSWAALRWACEGDDVAEVDAEEVNSKLPAALLRPLVCYIGANILLNLLRQALLSETSSTFLSDAIPPLGIVAGSVALMLYWRREGVLFKDQQGFPVLTVALGTLFATMPFWPLEGRELTLFVVCSLYEACFLVLMAACVEQRRHNGASVLVSWCSCMAVYYAFWPISEGLTRGIGEAFGFGFTGLCVVGLVVLLVLLVFNAASVRRTSALGLEEVVPSMDETGLRSRPQEEAKESAVARLRDCSVLVYDARISPREMDVLELVLNARSVPRIAGELYVSENTVKAHMKSIYAKMGVHSRQELIDAVTEALKKAR